MRFIFVVVYCLTVALADSDLDNKRENDIRECQEELNLIETDVQDPIKLGCFYYCMHRKLGLLNTDGTYNVKAIIGGSNDEVFEETMQQVIQRCGVFADGDACKMAYCLEYTKELKK